MYCIEFADRDIRNVFSPNEIYIFSECENGGYIFIVFVNNYSFAGKVLK